MKTWDVRTPIPTDRIVLLYRTATTTCWGCGPYRTEVTRLSARYWHWRTWNVLGPVTVEQGYSKSMDQGDGGWAGGDAGGGGD